MDGIDQLIEQYGLTMFEAGQSSRYNTADERIRHEQLVRAAETRLREIGKRLDEKLTALSLIEDLAEGSAYDQQHWNWTLLELLGKES